MADISGPCPVPESVVVEPAVGSRTERDREMNIVDSVEGEGKSACLTTYLWLKSDLQMRKASRTPKLPLTHAVSKPKRNLPSFQ